MTSITNYLTIDVEDYYQVSAFEDVVRPEQWDGLESRVERNTQIILKLLEEKNIKATFFVVGWVAERHPNLVREIVTCGHEIGCHSYLHRKVYDLPPEEFLKDTGKAKDIVENILGQSILGYRAPSYSITRRSLWALDILKELGFEYDSSIFPIHHDIYGIPDAPRFPFIWDLSTTTPQALPQAKHQRTATSYTTAINQEPLATRHHSLASDCLPSTANFLNEFPISTTRILGKNLPASGGGYFRLFPYWLTKSLLKKINNDEKLPFIFYLHPWELDPDQPRFNAASWKSRFRHYNNLHKTTSRFSWLLNDFSFGPIRA